MGSSQPKDITQTNKVVLSPQQQAIADKAMPYITNYASTPNTLFPGTAIAGFNPLETQGQNAAVGAAGTAGDLAGAAAGTQGKLLDLNFLLNPNQYVRAAADATTQQVTDNLKENILPAVRTGVQTTGGQYSGGATRGGVAEGLAIGKTNQALSQALSDMYFKNYTGGLATASNAVAANPSVIQSQIMPALWTSAVGAQQRSMAQAQLDEEVQKFYAGQQLDLNKAKDIMELVGTMPGATGVSTVTPSAPQSNPFSTGIGATMAILGLMSGNPMMALSGASSAAGGMGK